MPIGRRARTLIFVTLALGTAGCDQTTKRLAQSALAPGQFTSLASGTVNLALAHNPGAFLSLGAELGTTGRFVAFTLGVGVMLLALAGLALLSKRLRATQVAGLALVVGGGGSNLADRVLRGGTVIDFLQLRAGPLHTGIFNAADVAIVIGVLMLALPGRVRAITS